jgi:DSF synthase
MTYENSVSAGLPVVTIALIQGQALGGGLESALSCNVLVAERSAQFGLPEILFNLFPGMGAYSYLARRIGNAATERLILDGGPWSAAELHALGVIDVLAEDGQGEAAVRAYIARTARRHNAQCAVFRTRRRIWPLPYEELRDVTDIWVDCAMGIDRLDLRKMEKLVAAQDRLQARIQSPAIPQ